MKVQVEGIKTGGNDEARFDAKIPSVKNGPRGFSFPVPVVPPIQEAIPFGEAVRH